MKIKTADYSFENVTAITSEIFEMEDRFSLLYLEPGEIYFTDVAVTFCQNPDAKENVKIPYHVTPLSSSKKQEGIKCKGIYMKLKSSRKI